MSRKKIFEERYRNGETPWELSRPDKNLVVFVEKYLKPPAKVMDIGCGTGACVRWLAQIGFDATGVDFSPKAIEMAKEKAEAENLKARFVVKDFLSEQIIAPDFDFIFDRGCFHSFDEADDRAQFACNVSRHLKKEGLWFSILGNSDDEPRDTGPPMRTATQIVQAVEPYFEIQSIIAGRFDSTRERPAKCWLCTFKKRHSNKGQGR